VTYCNRKPVSELTSVELASWAEELGDIYLASGATKGAMIKLDQRAMVAASTVLTMSETFVLGHEIGHAVAGHLEDGSRLTADDRVPWLKFLAESPLRQDEFEVDRYGFLAMRGCFERASPRMHLGALASTFSTLSLIGAGRASESHPSAMDRIHRLVERHFSRETARLVRRWVDHGDPKAGVEALLTAH